MGTYVYALNTNVRTISGFTVGLAEYRYKECGMGFGGEDTNQKWYNKLCKRRVAFFEANNHAKMPTLMTTGDMNKPDTLIEGAEVYICAGACFGDYITRTKVGVLNKSGNRWVIDFLPNAEKVIAIHKEAMEFQAKARLEAENDY
jgi:hypothetical protein